MKRRNRARIVGLLSAAGGCCIASTHVNAVVTDITWNGANTTFGTTTNWTPQTAPSTTTDVVFNTTGVANPSLGVSTSVNGVVFQASGWTVTNSLSTYILKLVGGTDTGGDTGGDGITTTASSGTDTISPNLQLGTSSTSTDNGPYNINVANGNTLDLSTVTAYGGNSCILSFNGNSTGILNLGGSAANTFGSNLIVTGGTLQLNKPAGVNATGGKLIVDGAGTAIYEASNQIPSAMRLGDTSVINLNGFNQSLTALQFNNNSSNTAENGAGTIDLNGGTLNVSTGSAISTTATTTGITETTALIDGNGNPSSAVSIGGNATFTTNAGNTAIGLNINAPITGGSGDALTIAAAGTAPGAIEFSGANTYTATTIITTGTLVLNNSAALGGGGNLNLSGGKLQNGTSTALTVSNPVALTAGSYVIGTTSMSFTGSLTNTGGGETLNNQMSSGTLTLGGATAGAGNVYLSELPGTGRTLTLSGTGSTIVNAVIADVNSTGTPTPGNLTIGNTTYAAAVTLDAANTYTGTTTVTSGTLILGNSAALGGAGPLKLNGGALQNSTGLLVSITNLVTLAASSAVNGTGSLAFNSFTNAGTASNPLTLTNNLFSGTLTLGGATVPSGSVYLSANSANGSLTLGGSGSTIVNAVVADYNGAGAPGSLILSGGGSTTLNASDTYTGTTTLTGGTLILGNSAALGGGGTLKLNGGSLQNGTGSALGISNPVTLYANSAASGTTSLSFIGGLSNNATNPTLSNNLSSGTLTLGGSTPGSGSVYLSPSNTTSGTITLAGSGSTIVNAVISNFNGASGNASGGLIIGNPSSSPIVTLNTANTYSGNTNISSGNLILASAGALPANTGLMIASGAQMTVANHSGSAYVPVLSALSNSGTIDLTDNALVVHNGSIGTLFTQIQLGYAGGAWNGTNTSNGVITSSAAAGNIAHLTAVGVATGLISFEGSSVAGTDVLVKYTYYGDANLDGKVDGSDYSLIDNGFLSQSTGSPLTGWQNGDFNYDGVVNGSDYTLIDNAFNSQGSTIAAEVASPTAQIAGASGASSVPEPATLGLLGIGAAGLLGRRRRR